MNTYYNLQEVCVVGRKAEMTTMTRIPSSEEAADVHEQIWARHVGLITALTRLHIINTTRSVHNLHFLTVIQEHTTGDI